MTPAELGAWVHWGLHVGELAALFIFARDLCKCDDRVSHVETDDRAHSTEEHHLESQDAQLRQELDQIHGALKHLAKALPRETLTSWLEDDNSTVAGVPAERAPRGQTIAHALGPVAPALPSWAVNTFGAPQWQVCGRCGAYSHPSLPDCDCDDACSGGMYP